MLDVLRSDYIQTVTAKGLAGHLVILKHAFKMGHSSVEETEGVRARQQHGVHRLAGRAR